MDFLQPTSWPEALTVRAVRPEALAIAGGTDVMVELNFDRRRPAALLDLTRIPEAATWRHTNGTVRLGAGVTWTQVIDELADLLPGLAAASRTVGSPQIRNRGTVAGNLGSASPAGDAHPVLLACGATVEIASVRGTRSVPIENFFLGVKRSVLAEDELIEAVTVPVARGPERFAKVGTRNAMVIAVVSFGLALHADTHSIGTGIGSAAPTPRRAYDAERFLAHALSERQLWDGRDALPDEVRDEFGRLVAAGSAPIDDVRGSAAYRRHALSVMASRTLGWAWDEYRRAA